MTECASLRDVPPGDSRSPRVIDIFPIAGPRITEAMPLRDRLQRSTELRRKLFRSSFCRH